VNWAIYSTMGRDTLKRVGSARTVTAAMFLGWAMLIPFFVGAAGWQEYRHLSSASVIAVAFLGVGCSGLGYWFWYAALERIEATQVAAFLYVEPLITLLAALALLGESIAASTMLGGVLVLVGVLIVQGTPKRAIRDSSLEPSV